ncbi:hypothetical protein BDP55DRAFT_643568 [Colletotrichum godetiae]|uniref:Uncharacterized protein n=1 Tax=Colletotrichum godetiae TaxID=1209918 RepID=A0AAJ0AYJ4_9PEZI|nr:uncharacterized protein BDP55DRAFT_643568 [Colletotrichum godetiae]KAK1700593.1 hypothetical protein BDP55DRAFT_643568 [Colletotrichum godetiae]
MGGWLLDGWTGWVSAVLVIGQPWIFDEADADAASKIVGEKPGKSEDVQLPMTFVYFPRNPARRLSCWERRLGTGRVDGIAR